MKKTILLVLLTFSINIFAQDYTLEEKSITGVYDVENKTKSELFFMQLINGFLLIIILHKMLFK